MQIEYVRYLEAKRTVDDRALSSLVLHDFVQLLRAVPEGRPLRIVELGAGTGAMIRRLLAKAALPPNVDYTMVDIKADVLLRARSALTGEQEQHPQISPSAAELASADVHHQSSETASIEDAHLGGVRVRFCQASALQFLRQSTGRYDAVVACAFLDLVDLDEAIPLIRACLDPDSSVRAFYFPINFAGTTVFTPGMHGNLLAAFHKSMGSGSAAGKDLPRAETGLHISGALKAFGAQLVRSDSSDWSVRSKYVGDEAYFVQCIITFIANTPSVALEEASVSQQEKNMCVKRWEELVEQGLLKYEAKNVDVCGVFSKLPERP